MGGGLRRLVIVAAAECANTGQAVPNVGGIGNLAQFTVADAVDAGCDLLGDNIANGDGEARLKRGLIKFLAGLACFQKA